jgi:hypothetical protein
MGLLLGVYLLPAPKGLHLHLVRERGIATAREPGTPF